jgi:hypothetical protein
MDNGSTPSRSVRGETRWVSSKIVAACLSKPRYGTPSSEPRKEKELMPQYNLADARTLNHLKHHIRDVTKALDATGTTVFPPSREAAHIHHEVSVLLSELQVHGLWPANGSRETQREERQERR